MVGPRAVQGVAWRGGAHLGRCLLMAGLGRGRGVLVGHGVAPPRWNVGAGSSHRGQVIGIGAGRGAKLPSEWNQPAVGAVDLFMSAAGDAGSSPDGISPMAVRGLQRKTLLMQARDKFRMGKFGIRLSAAESTRRVASTQWPSSLSSSSSLQTSVIGADIAMMSKIATLPLSITTRHFLRSLVSADFLLQLPSEQHHYHHHHHPLPSPSSPFNFPPNLLNRRQRRILEPFTEPFTLHGAVAPLCTSKDRQADDVLSMVSLALNRGGSTSARVRGGDVSLSSGGRGQEGRKLRGRWRRWKQALAMKWRKLLMAMAMAIMSAGSEFGESESALSSDGDGATTDAPSSSRLVDDSGTHGFLGTFFSLFLDMFDRMVHRVQVVGRGMYVSVLLFPAALLACLGSVVSDGRVKEAAWNYFFRSLKLCGPCWVKFIQWAATRHDIFPQEFCQRCSVFHSDVPPHSKTDTCAILEKCVGINWEEFIEIADWQPVGAGCIAQVYKGLLLKPLINKTPSDIDDNAPDSNSSTLAATALAEAKSPSAYPLPVAIKIAHPDIASVMALDLHTMRWAGKLFSILPAADWLPLSEAVRQFSDLMERQVDFNREALNTIRFRENFLKPSAVRLLARLGGRLIVPAIYYSSSELLVESFEPGITVGNWLKLNQQKTSPAPSSSSGHRSSSPLPNLAHSLGDRNGVERQTPDASGTHAAGGSSGSGAVSLAALAGPHFMKLREAIGQFGLTAYLHMLFVDNFVHADLHPGNMLVRAIEKKKPEGQDEENRNGRRRTPPLSSSLSSSLSSAAPPQETSRGSPVSSSIEPTSDDTEMSKRRPRRLRRALIRVAAAPSNLLRKARLGQVKLLSALAAKVGGFPAEPKFEFILLDCGLATALAPRDLKNFRDLFGCIVFNEGYKAGQMILRRSRKQGCVSEEEFCNEVAEVVADHYDITGQAGLRLGKARLGDVLSRMLKISVRHRVELDPAFVSIILSMMIIEGVGRQIAPDVDLLKWAAPFLARSAR